MMAFVFAFSLLLASASYADDIVRATVFQANTGGGTQDVTISGIGTPTGVLFLGSHANADHDVSGVVAESNMVVGAYDGTNSFVAATGSIDNVGTSNTGRAISESHCFGVVYTSPPFSTTFNGIATCAFIADGVRLTWSTTPVQDANIIALFFSGDTDFAVGSFYPNATVDNAVDIASVGFEPHSGMLIGVSEDVVTSHNVLSVGFFDNSSSDTQTAHGFLDTDGTATTSVNEATTGSYAYLDVLGSGIAWACEVGSFDASGFSCTTRLGNANADEKLGYVAWRFAGDGDHWTGLLQAPASATTTQYTSIGFQPTFGIMLPTNAQTLDVRLNTSDNVGFMGACVLAEDFEGCVGMMSQDLVETSNTASVYDNTALICLEDDQSIAYEASFSQWISTGVELDFSTTENSDYIVSYFAQLAAQPEPGGRRRVAPWQFN